MTDRDTGSEHGSACELSDIVPCLVHAPCDKFSYLDVAFFRKMARIIIISHAS